MPSYKHTDAVAYARKYALTVNPSYPPFPNDCTNFVSQAMLAGGWTMLGGSFFDRTDDRVWWYNKSHFSRASYTWAGAQNFANFVAASKRGTKAASPMDLEPGDVLQILEVGHAYHSMVVTRKNATDLFLSYHTSAHLDEPLSKIMSRLPSGQVFLPWKMAKAF